MQLPDLADHWQKLSAELAVSMSDWRLAHPHATFQEIETALDARWFGVRAQILQGAASSSPLADVTAAQQAGTAVLCPGCGQPLAQREQAVRQLTTQGEQTLQLERSYTICPGCGAGLFPPG